MTYTKMVGIRAAIGIGGVVAFRTLLDVSAPHAASGPELILATVLIACAATEAADWLTLQFARRKGNDSE